MAAQPPNPAGSPPSAQVVGNSFVHQYYHILHQSPQLVHRFYQESSRLGRLEDDGMMSSVTTLEAINEKILAMDFVRAEIKTVDAQESLSGGVTVLVTGHLTGKDNVKRGFTQSFFLAPQEKGYFVLNDIFQYVGEGEEEDRDHGDEALANGPAAPIPFDTDPPHQQEQHVPGHPVLPPEPEDANEEEIYDSSDEGEGSVTEEEAPVAEVIDEAPNSTQGVVPVGSSAPAAQEEAPKKSYASIVMKDNAASSSVQVHPARPVPPKLDRQVVAPAAAPAVDVPAFSSSASESSNVQELEPDGHSIYIRNLPLNAMASQLEEEFKRFGTIKPGGIQVRSNKIQGFCFGFVEFEEASAAQNAIEASPVIIGGRQAFIEEKRATGSRASNRGRFPPGRGGGFRNDGMRGRGNYGSGRGYGRGDFNYRADYGSRGGGFSNRGGEMGYQRVDHMGSGSGSGNRPGTSTPGVN